MTISDNHIFEVVTCENDGRFPNVLVYTHFVCSLMAELPEKAIYDRDITPSETWCGN